jgi:integrase
VGKRAIRDSWNKKVLKSLRGQKFPGSRLPEIPCITKDVTIELFDESFYSVRLKGIRLHDGRHTFASIHLKNGTHVKIV